jgi:hypothetical protein
VDDRSQRHVHLAAFDALKLAHANAKPLGGNLLGPPARLSDLPDTPSQVPERAKLSGFHCAMVLAAKDT